MPSTPPLALSRRSPSGSRPSARSR
jgi:hypothetical protein